MGVVADHRAVLVGAVVIGGDAACADVGSRTHRGVAEVGEVVCLGAIGERRVLHLDEVADVHVGPQFGTRPQPCERPDHRARPDAHTERIAVDVGEGLDHGAGCDRGVSHHAVRADLHPIAQMHRALEHAVHIDLDVGAAVQLATQVEPRRVQKANAGVHERVGALTLHDALELGQLLRAVHAQHFRGRGGLGRDDRDTVGHRHRDHIGQVVLALGVAVVQSRQPVAKATRRRRHRTGVDLADGALRLARVLVLDDRSDRRAARARTPHDAAVAARVVEVDGEQCEPLAATCVGQSAQGGRADHGRVAVDDEGHSRDVGVQPWCGLLHRVACAELGRLAHALPCGRVGSAACRCLCP